MCWDYSVTENIEDIKIESQRNWIPKNPVWIVHTISNCYENSKPVIESIKEKMVLRGIREENLAQDMQDIAGLRVMVQFVDDVEEVLDVLRKRHDMRIIQERDYIKNRKASGYRSYHVIIEYPVDTINGSKTILAEIQIRTLSMNFWATIEHSLNYKYKGEFPDEIKKRLEITAKIAYQLDEEMGKIRDDIQEAQALFDPISRKLNDGVGNSDDTDEEYR